MSPEGAVAAVTLCATACTSLSTALKHRSAGLTAHTHRPNLRELVTFVVETTRHPLWLAALVADGVGFALQVIALHLGALTVVQPLMITALVFSLVLNHWVAGTRVSARELSASAVLVSALVGFLFVSGASSPDVTGPPQPADRRPAVAVAVATVVIAAVCIWTARRSHGSRAASLMGVAVGLVYACTAAVIKSGSNVLTGHGPLAVLTSWQLYAAVVTGASGLLLAQLAFQAGPLRSSLPSIATVDPLASIVLGILVYDEHLRHGPGALTAEVLCLALLCATAIYLSRIRASEPTDRASPRTPADGSVAAADH